ncbi:heavy-metal-associated domain-containing protein [Pontibacter sp. FD36]|uniref:heavy-metal-associated domain-containing protein n=1 Tax=Pontibacter sp. FD36 TaxID=2789860 RepID=UPI0018A9F621|nr:heavy metal-associated domain-containing protein [Pontibacter sp. FD36]MBF8961713.1 heavy-metal-associated domain-containing protein [Pontibacter sp. FD36]
MEKTEENMTSLHLRVEGMSCQAGCADGIDRMLKQQEGIVKSKTTFNVSTSDIVFDKRKISAEQIVRLIEARGFSTKKD